MNKTNIFYNKKYKLLEKQRNDQILFNNIVKVKSNINNNLKKEIKIKKNDFKRKNINNKILRDNKILYEKICKINQRNKNKSRTNKTINKFNQNKDLFNLNNKTFKKKKLEKNNTSYNNIDSENYILLYKKSIKYKNDYFYYEVILNKLESIINLSIDSEEINFTKKYTQNEWESLIKKEKIDNIIISLINEFDEENSKEDIIIKEYHKNN